MRHHRVTQWLVIPLLLVALAQSAEGQHAQTRRGVWFNVSGGYGTMGCEGCLFRAGGISGGLSFGTTLGSHILLGVGTSGWYRSDDRQNIGVGTLDARIRLYPIATSGFYLTAGAGAGVISSGVEDFDSVTEYGGAGLLGVGYDIRIGTMVSLTPFVNGFVVKTADGRANVVQAGIGFTFH